MYVDTYYVYYTYSSPLLLRYTLYPCILRVGGSVYAWTLYSVLYLYHGCSHQHYAYVLSTASLLLPSRRSAAFHFANGTKYP
jgi:hypothetical protein